MDTGGNDGDDREVLEMLATQDGVVHVGGGAHERDFVRLEVDFRADDAVIVIGAVLRNDAMPGDVGFAFAALVVDKIADGFSLATGDGRGAEDAMGAEEFGDDEAPKAANSSGFATVEGLVGVVGRHEKEKWRVRLWRKRAHFVSP